MLRSHGVVLSRFLTPFSNFKKHSYSFKTENNY